MTNRQRRMQAKTPREFRALVAAERILEASGLRYQSGQIPGLALILMAFAENELRLASQASGAVPVEDFAVDPVGRTGTEGLRALNDSLDTTSSLAAVPAQEEGSRYFVNVNGFKDGTAFVRVDAEGRAWIHHKDGSTPMRYTASNLAACLEKVDRGIWREFAPAAPHDARETTDVQKNQEDTRVKPSSTLPSQGSTARNHNGR